MPDPPGEVRWVVSPDGTRLRCHVTGPERPRAVVVLSHGWTLGALFWRDQVRALAPHALVLAYDQRGHQGSESPASGDWSTAALADDLEAVIQQAAPAGLPLLVVGHSLGAMTVLAWTARHPGTAASRLRGVVLCNAGIHQLIPAATAGMPGGAWALPRLVEAFLTVPTPTPPRSAALRWAIRHMGLGESPPAAAVALTEALVASCPPGVRAGFGRTIRSLDLRAAVGFLDAPTLLITGGADRMTPAMHAHGLAARLCGAEVVVLPGVGHQAPLERPATVSDLILTHLHRCIPATLTGFPTRRTRAPSS